MAIGLTAFWAPPARRRNSSGRGPSRPVLKTRSSPRRAAVLKLSAEPTPSAKIYADQTPVIVTESCQ